MVMRTTIIAPLTAFVLLRPGHWWVHLTPCWAQGTCSGCPLPRPALVQPAETLALPFCPCALVPCSCDTGPQTRWLSTIHCCLMVLEVRGVRSRGGQGGFLLEAPRGNRPGPSLLAPGGCRQPSAFLGLWPHLPSLPPSS